MMLSTGHVKKQHPIHLYPPLMSYFALCVSKKDVKSQNINDLIVIAIEC